ncbi:MAG: GNAT family protein [Oscillospiraceae bacterium]|jgi:ribosomal-protein-alanine N-acetyltransferase
MDFSLLSWKADYAKSIAINANNINIAKNLRNVFPYPYTLSDAEFYVNMCIEADEKTQCTRAIVVDGKAVGSIGFFLKDDVYSKSAEIGYWLGEPFWRKGIMSCAIKLLCDFGFENYDIVRIFAEPYSHNIGSRRALEKAGFLFEGEMKKSVFKNGEFFDSCMYAIIR